MARIREEDLSRIWQAQRLIRPLVTELGDHIEVVYPGRRNDNRGGDFCDAVIAFPGLTVKGDVELHVSPEDWRRHGHCTDSHYNNVVLHVVYSHGKDGVTVLENGKSIPVLALEGLIAPDGGSSPVAAMCRGPSSHRDEESVGRFLELEGRRRFLRKAAVLGQRMKSSDPAQVLYERMMCAMGYSRNKAPFVELSRRLPLVYLEGVARSFSEEAQASAAVHGLFLGVSGLGNDDSREGLDCTSGRPEIGSMASNSWQMFRARPGNSPGTRMAAMSRLIARHRGGGLLAGMLEMVRDAPRRNGASYMRRVISCGQASRWTGQGGVPVGTQRCDDILVNVVLPFTFALADAAGQELLRQTAWETFLNWPRLGSNCIERHVLEQARLPRHLAGSAVRQQGLLEIYEKRCVLGGCRSCVLSHFEAGQYVQVESGAGAGEVTVVAD